MSEKLRPAGLGHERGDRLKDAADLERIMRRGGWDGGERRAARACGPDGGVPASRQFKKSGGVPKARVETFGAHAMRARKAGLTGGGEGAGQDDLVLRVEIRGLPDKVGDQRLKQFE